MKIKIKKEIKIGMVFLLTILALVWGYNFFKGKNILKRSTALYAVYDRIEGLEESAPVVFRGYKIGIVKSIHFKDQGSKYLVIEMYIKRQYKIPDKSTARIFSSDLMGTKSIDIIISDSKKFCDDGDTLLSTVEATLTEQVSVQMLPLKNKAENLMKQMQDVLAVVSYVFNEQTKANLIKSFESILISVKNIQQASYALDTVIESGKTRFANIVTNVESISRNLKNKNDDINKILSNISDISDTIAKAKLSATMLELNNSVAQIKEIAAKG